VRTAEDRKSRRMGNPGRRTDLYLRAVRGMGRGVFAGRAFRAGEVIEVCPVIPLPVGTDEAALPGELPRYIFKWGNGDEALAIVLGYGSIYNHSTDPNAYFAPRTARREMVFRAARRIAAGEQILVDYGWDEEDYAGFR
jgi:SET domain-containing protein